MRIYGPDNTRAGMYHLTVGRKPQESLCGKPVPFGTQLMSFWSSEVDGHRSVNDCAKCWAAGRRARAAKKAGALPR